MSRAPAAWPPPGKFWARIWAVPPGARGVPRVQHQDAGRPVAAPQRGHQVVHSLKNTPANFWITDYKLFGGRHASFYHEN